MNKQRLYIAYGSNLNLEQMEYRCPTAKVVGSTEIEGYQLVFKGNRKSAVATIEPKEDASVPILIWDIQKTDEKSLDVYEGYPIFYIKEMQEVEIDGQSCEAMVYVMNEGYKYGMPSTRYLDTIKKGYMTAGFDLSKIEQAITVSADLANQESNKDIDFKMY